MSSSKKGARAKIDFSRRILLYQRYNSRFVAREGITVRTIQKFFWVSAVAASILFAACTTTKFKTVWKDDLYEGNPAKIMVIGVSGTPAVRRLLEDEFVKEFNDRKTDAIASYTVLPDQAMADESAIAAKAKEVGADTVLITESVGRKTGSTVSPWGTYVDLYIDTETIVYDMKSNKPIWTALTETWVRDSQSEKSRIRAFVKLIVRRLSEQELVKAEPATSNIKSY
jgi:hypothetical protein